MVSITLFQMSMSAARASLFARTSARIPTAASAAAVRLDSSSPSTAGRVTVSHTDAVTDSSGRVNSTATITQ